MKKTFRAFTLIELLVVIGIIALMMAILAPSLIKAKTISRRVVCASGLRQISIAISTYSADNNDDIIIATEMTFAHGISEFTQAWHIALMPYIQQQINTTKVLDNYAELWFCPEDKDPYPRGFYNNPHEGMASYGLNGFYQSDDGRSSEIKFGPAGGYKFSEVKNSSSCMLMGETSYASQFYDIENSSLAAYGIMPYGHHRMTSAFFHAGKMNTLMVDGHIEVIDKIKCNSQPQFIPSYYTTGEYQFWPNSRLPDSKEKPQFWGPGYAN